jgi:hypothetical protein
MGKINNKQIELYPSCSEMVFRLNGDFEEIRQQMYNIVEWTRKEYCGECGDGKPEKLSPQMKKQIDEVNQKIKEATSLEDFEKIVIEFTCNYETFFKEDENGDGLLVATCNNYNWDDVEKQDVCDDETDYYKVAGKTSYILKSKIDGHYIFKLKYADEDHKDYPMYIYADKGQIFYEDRYDGHTKEVKKGKSVKFVTRGDAVYTLKNNHLIKVDEIQDKALLNKLKILANLED